MQIRHQLAQVTMGGNQAVIHVARMAGGVTKAGNPRNARQTKQKFAQAPFATIVTSAVPGIHVLAEQGQFTHAAVGKALGLRHNLLHTARNFRAARIGNHAEGTELVAALLHGQER